jgi:hypothetical protein
MSDLLKEAIADAKTVRETAIANAKMALEEAFTPHLKSMLSAKLAEDDMEDDEDEKENPFDKEETYGDEDEMRGDHDEEMRGDHDEEMGDEDEEMGMGDDDEPEMEEEGVIEINGVKYAPVMSEEEDEMEDEEEAYHEGEDKELDLESVIKELESEIKEADEDEDGEKVDEAKDDEDDEKVDEDIVTEEDEEDEDKDKTDEQSTSSGIGKGTGVKMASASDEEDLDKGKDKPMSNESVELKAELKEYKEAVSFLREKLHEVNILNAKLLYTNRLFKEYVLSNDQKMKIVETFDRAQTAREIKLVYSTLAESFKGGSVKKTRVQESASVKSGTTKPTKKIITEESEVASRFKKLAGII